MTITDASVRAQMADLAQEHVVPDPPRFTKCVARLRAETPDSFPDQLEHECRSQYTSLREQAQRSLMAAQWLLGAVYERGLSLPDGSQSAKARAAEGALRRSLAQAEPKPTPPEIAAYYQENIEHYERPEQRKIEIVEHIPTKREAQALLKGAKRWGSITGMPVRPPILRLPESIPNSNLSNVPPPRRAALRAIFAASPHTLVGPVPLNEQWCVFEVTDVTPRAVTPLAEVRGAIERQLAQERQRRTLASFIAGWRRKWLARTDCSPGYVIQKCRQYQGPKTPEDPYSFS